MKKKLTVTKGSGNIYADLGFPQPEAELAKAQLALRINDILCERGLNQTQSAKVLHIDQAKVSALSRGNLSGFSMDRLVRFLNALDRDVEIVIRSKPASRKLARVRVAAQ